MILPYITSILLGSTFNYNNMDIGVMIFDQQQLGAHTETISRYSTRSIYQKVSSLSDKQDVLDISGELSLRILSGKIDVKGAGQYMKSDIDRSNTIEILCRQTFETVTKTLRAQAKPEENWDKSRSHYVRSITYGGQLLASLKFTTTSKEDFENLNAQLSLNLNFEKVNADVAGKLSKLSKELSSSTTMTIEYFATQPVGNIPRSVEGFSKLISEFKDRVQEVNGGLGNPISMEIVPREALTTGLNLDVYTRDVAVESKLEELMDKYSDIRDSFNAVEDYQDKILGTTSYEENLLIAAYYKNVSDVRDIFLQRMAALNVSKDGDPEQFKPAFDAYREGGENIPGKFYRNFEVLVKTIEGMRNGCFSRTLVNQYILTPNLQTDARSIKQTGALSMQNCLNKCREEPECLSFTLVAARQAPTGVCFLNYLPADQSQRIDVKAGGYGDINVYVKFRGQEFCARKK